MGGGSAEGERRRAVSQACTMCQAVLRESVDGKVTLTRGADTSRLSAVDRGHLHRLFAGGDVIELGTDDPEFTATWQAIKAEEVAFTGAAGRWSRGGPGGSSGSW